MNIEAVNIVRQNRIDLNGDGKFNNEDLVLASKGEVITFIPYNENLNKIIGGDDFVKTQSPEMQALKKQNGVSNANNPRNSYYDMKNKLNEIERYASYYKEILNSSMTSSYVGIPILCGTCGLIAGVVVGTLGAPILLPALTVLGTMAGFANADEQKKYRDELRDNLRNMIAEFDVQYFDNAEAQAELEKIKQAYPWL